MPFVTEYRRSQILKEMFHEIPEDVNIWEPYKVQIEFLNKLDKTILWYFLQFCENPNKKITYNPVEVVDSKNYVYEGVKPSYHKYEECKFLHSNYVNYPIPSEIKEKGEEVIAEYRIWFKENEDHFTRFPEQFNIRMKTKFNIIYEGALPKIDYLNSGNIFKENLTLTAVKDRIDSLLENSKMYLKLYPIFKNAIWDFQKSTYLAFKEDVIEKNTTGFSDSYLKIILQEYHKLFVEPTKFYLTEYFRISNNADIELDKEIFEELNFKKCGHCYSEEFNKDSILTKQKELKEKFGNYEFPLEPTVFRNKNTEDGSSSICFIYCRVWRQIKGDFQEDENGERFKLFKIEFINHKNQFIYKNTKIYETDLDEIQLFRKYLTKIVKDKISGTTTYRTYAYGF